VTLVDFKQDISQSILEKDLEVIYTTGSGPGGQRKNRKKNCVNMKHIPTGIKVRIDGRNQHQNYIEAKRIIEKKLNVLNKTERNNKFSKEKKEQIKNVIRTYNVKTGIVKDHISKKTISLKKAYKGKIGDLH